MCIVSAQGYAQFIINVMGRICAPVRDEKIQELKQISDPVLIYRGVLEVMSRLLYVDLSLVLCSYIFHMICFMFRHLL